MRTDLTEASGSGWPRPGERPGFVLLASAGHSGSTLLDLLLGNHSAISSAGEMNRLSLYPAERVCACGTVVLQCPYWTRVRARLGQRNGRPTNRWDSWHTDVPPLEPLIEFDGGPDFDLRANAPPPLKVVHELAARGISLSDGVRLTHGGVRDVKWQILDEATRTKLILRREEGLVRIYLPLREWKNPLRRIPSPLELALALGFDRGVHLLARISRGAARHVETAQNSWHVADAMAAEDGTRYVVDSSKSAIRLKLLYLLQPSRIRVIHLVRDGRAVAASAMRRHSATAAIAARSWKRENQHLAMVLRGVPAAQKLRIRYEDLCADPARELAGICAFLDLEFEPSMVRLWERPVHNIPGNPMLFQKDRRSISTDERWRRDLSADERKMIDAIAGGLNRWFGYSRE